MNAPQILEALTQHGALATVEGETLWIEPTEVLTDALRAEIRAQKPALIELLAHGDRYAPEAPPLETPSVPQSIAPTPATEAERNTILCGILDERTGGQAAKWLDRTMRRLIPQMRRDVEKSGGAEAVEKLALSLALLACNYDPNQIPEALTTPHQDTTQ